MGRWSAAAKARNRNRWHALGFWFRIEGLSPFNFAGLAIIVTRLFSSVGPHCRALLVCLGLLSAAGLAWAPSAHAEPTANGTATTLLESAKDTASGVGSSVTGVEVGFAGRFKLGSETSLFIKVEGIKSPMRLEAFAPDPDNLPVMTSTAVSADGVVVVPMTVGRKNATLRTRLIVDETDTAARVVDDQTWQLESVSNDEASDKSKSIIQLAATDPLVVCFGAITPALVEKLYQVEEGGRPSGGTQALKQRDLSRVNMPGVADLNRMPRSWRGYEAANAVMLHLGSAEELSSASMPERLIALRQWVEMGGQLILSCSPDCYAQLSEMPALKVLIPGATAGAYQLDQFAAIEAFATATDPLPRTEGTQLTLVRLSEPSGLVEASIGRDATQIPLVIRKPFGLGEVVFATFDLAAPELQQWPGLPALVNQLLGGQGREEILMEMASTGQLVSRGYNDLAGALYQKLGTSFSGATNLSMITITAIALAYIVVIGPLDWLLVTRGLKRPGLTWVTFPLVALLLGCGLWQASNWVKAPAVCVNSVELVDIDTDAGLLRGQLLAQVYSPGAQRYDMTLSAQALDGSELTPSLESIGWWGLPGAGLGGMQSSASEAPLVGGYAFASALASQTSRAMIQQMPLNTGSTKAVAARWQDQVEEAMDVDLIANNNGLIEGSLVNQTGCDLQSCRLVYGQWAWRLKTIRNGDLISIDESLAPLKFRTLLKRDMQAMPKERRPREGQPIQIDVDELSPDKLLQLIMFSERGDAEGLVEVDSQALSYLDLSRHLSMGRAVLYARCEQPRSQLQLTTNGESFTPEAGNRTVFYRFSLPVSKDFD